MARKEENEGEGLGFLDPIAHLFRGREKPPPPAPETSVAQESIEARFEAALEELDDKIEQLQRAQGAGPAVGPADASERDRAAADRRRMEEAHAAIREDIERMHRKLGTELAGADLSRLAADVAALQASAEAGRGSHDLMPRLRHAIAERLNHEAGRIAIERLMAAMRREGIEWPGAHRPRPNETPEEAERARRRSIHDVREYFLAQDLERTSQRMLGVVTGWGPDYPDRGSAPWEECVLEGVAAGLRAAFVREAAELLRRDLDLVLARARSAIGKELEAIHSAVEGGVHTLDQANRVAASALRALDEVVPDLAWQHVCSQLPWARDESPPADSK
ncbi:MAG TPA: hypothetical protein VKB65_12000 [Myxococcota bacterium]|nr:hypothetical protein [Myxococcota bacterium]